MRAFAFSGAPMTRILTAALLALALTSCASTQSHNDALYAQQVQAIRADQQARADRLAAQQAQIQSVAAKCTSDSCAIAVAGFAALAAAQSGQGNAQPLPAPPYERDSSAKAKDWIGALASVAVPLASAAVNWHQADANTKTQIAQYDFLGSLVSSTSSAAVAVAQAGPRIEVGGSYVTGQVGDSIAGDGNATRASQVGDYAGRDSVGRDRNDGSVVGDGNRIGSPGPFENVGNCQSNAGNAAAGGPASGDGSVGGSSGSAGAGGCGGG